MSNPAITRCSARDLGYCVPVVNADTRGFGQGGGVYVTRVRVCVYAHIYVYKKSVPNTPNVTVC